MKPMNEYDKESIMDESVFKEIFQQQDLVYRSQLIASLYIRAKELGIWREFNRVLKAYEESEKQKSKDVSLVEHWTNFTGGDYDRMKCGQWIATDDGVCLYNPENGRQDVVACRHPIMPVRRMKNLQTDEEQVTIAFKRNGIWMELTVPKTTISQASKICGLSAKSVLVTSENAKLLVRYLADVEADNEGDIPLVLSSSKMGWVHGSFLPYDTDIVFDGGTRFKQFHQSICSHGNRLKWYEHMKALRETKRFEIKFFLAASFASILVGAVGGLPFMVDLWGESGGGKSVTLMVAASVWGRPVIGAYMRDYGATDVGFEAAADFLNDLPLMLDDTSKRDEKTKMRFEEIIYNLCSGKGKTRSNKELGINRESTWNCITMTNGEKPITSYVSQGGAINRVLEIESDVEIFSDPQKTLDVIKENYGFAGKDFVDVVKEIGIPEIKRIQKEFQNQLISDDKMQKQAISLSIVLTADRIATDYLFKDGRYISISEAKNILIDRNEISDNERCYQYIVDKVGMNAAKFDLQTNTEKWGILEDGYAIFYPQALEELCQNGGFSRTAFTAWAAKKGILLQSRDGKNSKQKKINGRNTRCYFIKLPNEDEMDGEGNRYPGDGTKIDKDGFVHLDENVQLNIPFLEGNP